MRQIFSYRRLTAAIVVTLALVVQGRAQSAFTWSASSTGEDVRFQGFIPISKTGHSCYFEYGSDSAALTFSTPEQHISKDSSNVFVQHLVSKEILTEGEYFFRLLLKTDTGIWRGRVKSFIFHSAKPPETKTLDATYPGAIEDFRPPTMTLNGLVNPNNSPTSYYFEYGEAASYGLRTTRKKVGPKLNAYFVEKWNDEWLGNWYSWGNLESKNDDPSSDGYASAIVPQLVDLNHHSEGAVGPISLIMYGYHSGLTFFDSPPFRLGGNRSDLRDAKLSVRFRTSNFLHNNTQLSFWIQAQPHNKSWSSDVPASNWALTSLSMTDYTSSDWSTVNFELTNDANQWKNAGTNFHADDPWRYSYERLDDALGNANMDFIFVALNVDPSNPPMGTVDFDEMTMRYRNYSLLTADNGGSLIAWPNNSSADPFTLTDGVKNFPKNGWNSTSYPMSSQSFIYEMKNPVNIDAIQIHQNPQFPAKTVIVYSSADGISFAKIDSLTLPEAYHALDNRAYVYKEYPSPPNAKYIKFEIIDGYSAIAWGISEIEVFGSGSQYGPGDEVAGVNMDVTDLEIGQTYHYRLVAENELGKHYGEDKTFTIPANPIQFTTSDTIVINDLYTIYEVKAVWETFDSSSERIRYKSENKPAWLELDENEGLISINFATFDFKDSEIEVTAFDPRGRFTKKKFFIKNNFHLIENQAHYVYTNTIIELSSNRYPTGFWTGEGDFHEGVFYPNTSVPGANKVSYSVMVGGEVVSEEIVVHVKEIPSILVDQKSLCHGDTVMLSVKENFHQYKWSNGATSNTIYVTESGDYSVEVYDSLFGTLQLEKAVVALAEKPLMPAIEVTNQNTLKSSLPCSTCEWIFADTVILPAKGQTTVIDREGTYNVRINNNGCYSPLSEDFVVDWIINPFGDPVHVYPNPNDGLFAVKLAFMNEPYELTILNSMGVPVFQKSYPGGKRPGPIKMPGLANGTYILLLKGASTTIPEKFIVIR